MKRIEIKASELNELYNTVNYAYKIGKIPNDVDTNVQYKENVLRFTFDRHMGKKGHWVVSSFVSVVYDEDI
jgi:hypothetical protein